MSCVAVVPYERRPRFVFSAGASSTICRWNPYHILGLVPEQVDSLISLLSCSGRDPIAHRTLQLRQAEIRAAYLDLAAAYHPDADKQIRSSAFTWISTFDHFAAISSSYKVLNDLIHAVEYGVASMNPEGESDILDCTASEKYGRLVRELRHQKALLERVSMEAHIAETMEVQRKRQKEHGDGFFVRSALYGDARTLSSVLQNISGGKPCNAARIAAKHPVLLDVTDIIQSMVEITDRDSSSEAAVVQLVLPAGSKATLEGIWDPCDGNSKKLWIRYEFLERVHEALIDDEASLKCPLKKHLIKPAPAPVAVLQPSRTAQASPISSPSKTMGQFKAKTMTSPTITFTLETNENALPAEDPSNDKAMRSPTEGRSHRQKRAIAFSVRSPPTSPPLRESEANETYTKVTNPETGEVSIVKTKTPRKQFTHAVTLAPSARLPRVRPRGGTVATEKHNQPINITVNVQLPHSIAQTLAEQSEDTLRILAKLKALGLDDPEHEKTPSFFSSLHAWIQRHPFLAAAAIMLVAGGSIYGVYSIRKHNMLADMPAAVASVVKNVSLAKPAPTAAALSAAFKSAQAAPAPKLR